MSTNLALTAREMELLKAIGKYIQASNVAWNKISEECNFKTAKAARDKWYPLRDKLFGAATNGGTDTPKKTPATPKSGMKRKAASEATPSKKKAKGKKAAAEEDDLDDEELLGGKSTMGFVKDEPKSDDDGDLLE